MQNSTSLALVGACLALIFQPPHRRKARANGQDPGLSRIGNMLYGWPLSKGYCDKYGIKCQLQMIPSAPWGRRPAVKIHRCRFRAAEVQINAMLKGAELRAILGGANLNIYIIVVRNDLDVPNASKGFPADHGGLKG